MHGMGTAQRGGGNLGQADALHLARAHQIGQSVDAVLDRHLLVPSVQVIEVDDVGLQALQAFLAGSLDRPGTAIDDALAFYAGHAALAGKEYVLPVRLEHAAEQRFVLAEAV